MQVFDAGQGAAVINQIFYAKLANITSLMLLGKYSIGQWKFYSGFEYMRFGDPSDPKSAFTDVAGDFVCINCQAFNQTSISNTGFLLSPKKEESWWAGARYSVTKDLDVVGAFYNLHYGNYDGTAQCRSEPWFSSNCH